jgi:hypothetical protein
MVKFAVKEWAELISDPISMKEQDQRVFKHADLPIVNDKLSITLRLKIHKHFSDWNTVFHKGSVNYAYVSKTIVFFRISLIDTFSDHKLKYKYIRC